MTVLFWVLLALLFYSYILYPIILKLVVSPKPVTLKKLDEYPPVDIIIAAYNEESCIKARIENALAQDYPGKLQILVGSDGSQDATGEIIESFTDSRVQAYNFSVNRGKISVLNDLVAKSTAEILVFTDANTDFQPDAVSLLVRSFDKNIGAVSGELILETEDGNQNVDGFYWRYEQFLKESESQLGSMLGANGAIYAMYRKLYLPLPTDTIIDDFCIVMNVKKQGYDTIYNNQAVATEEVAPSIEEEFGRRVRIGIGNYKAFFANLWALSPTIGLMSWCYWSHKVIRWFAPHIMLALLIVNMLLLDTPSFMALFAGQCLFYAIAFYGLSQIKNGYKIPKFVAIISFFVSMNLALAKGFLRFCKGHKNGGWKSTARQGEKS